MNRDDLPLTTESLVERIRSRDARIPYVERAFLARQLGLGRDDLELLPDAVVETLLSIPTSVSNVIGAQRLLEHLDAHVAREHPVNVDHEPSRTVARVWLPGDEELTVALDGGFVTLPDGRQVLPDDAEHLAYALLRLVEYAREKEHS